VTARPRQAAQAAVELLAAIPILVLAGLLAWQLAGVLAAAVAAEQRVRLEALRAAGGAGHTALVSASERVPALLPGTAGLRVVARAAIRLP
jgi:hypothetical protein